MISVRTSILYKNIRVTPHFPIFMIFFIIHVRKKLLDQNDIELILV